MSSQNNLIETICIKNGRVQRINYHNDRCNASRKELFNETTNLNLRKYIDTSLAHEGITKCRITYNKEVLNVEYERYKLRPIKSIRLFDIGNYTYSHKYADRSDLDTFFMQRRMTDDILMVKDGYITDTYYANVALLKNGIWYTPENPLLKGTMLTYLLEKGKVIPKKIKPEHLKTYQAIRLFNAMMEFGCTELLTSKVLD